MKVQVENVVERIELLSFHKFGDYACTLYEHMLKGSFPNKSGVQVTSSFFAH
jgi:hypothetical protein